MKIVEHMKNMRNVIKFRLHNTRRNALINHSVYEVAYVWIAMIPVGLFNNYTYQYSIASFLLNRFNCLKKQCKNK